LEEGIIKALATQGTQSTIVLTNGITVPHYTVRAAGFTNSEGKIVFATAIRGNDMMTDIALPPPAPKQPPMSPWYQHWKDIATMTTGILPDEPRFKLIASMVDRCNEAYTKGDEPTFLRLKGQLQNLINASNPKAARQAP